MPFLEEDIDCALQGNALSNNVLYYYSSLNAGDAALRRTGET